MLLEPHYAYANAEIDKESMFSRRQSLSAMNSKKAVHCLSLRIMKISPSLCTTNGNADNFIDTNSLLISLCSTFFGLADFRLRLKINIVKILDLGLVKVTA